MNQNDEKPLSRCEISKEVYDFVSKELAAYKASLDRAHQWNVKMTPDLGNFKTEGRKAILPIVGFILLRTMQQQVDILEFYPEESVLDEMIAIVEKQYSDDLPDGKAFYSILKQRCLNSAEYKFILDRERKTFEAFQAHNDPPNAYH